jgi:hypothetical protein
MNVSNLGLMIQRDSPFMMKDNKHHHRAQQ